MTGRKKAFEIIVGKGENAGTQHFLLYPTMISIPSHTNLNILFILSSITFILSSAIGLKLEWTILEFCWKVKGFKKKNTKAARA